MTELETIIKTTECSLEDAINYLSARTLFYLSVRDCDKRVHQYHALYVEASNKIYGKKEGQ